MYNQNFHSVAFSQKKLKYHSLIILHKMVYIYCTKWYIFIAQNGLYLLHKMVYIYWLEGLYLSWYLNCLTVKSACSKSQQTNQRCHSLQLYQPCHLKGINIRQIIFLRYSECRAYLSEPRYIKY